MHKTVCIRVEFPQNFSNTLTKTKQLCLVGVGGLYQLSTPQIINSPKEFSIIIMNFLLDRTAIEKSQNMKGKKNPCCHEFRLDYLLSFPNI